MLKNPKPQNPKTPSSDKTNFVMNCKQAGGYYFRNDSCGSQFNLLLPIKSVHISLNQKMMHLPFFLFKFLLSLSLSAESSSFDFLALGEFFPPSVLISYCSSASRIFCCWSLTLADLSISLLSGKASATPVASLLLSSGLCYGKSL